LNSSIQPARLPRTLYVFTVFNAAFTLLFALILRLTRANHYGPHANGVAIAHRNFADLLDFTAQFRFFHSAAFFHQPTVFMHPASLAVAYHLVFLFGSRAVAAYAAALLLTVAAAVILFTRALIRRGIVPLRAAIFAALTLIFAWPAWFCLKQGNFEFLLFALLALGLCAFLHRRHYPAAACFAIAGVMKFYPFLFLGLLLAARRYRAFFFGLTIAATTLLLSLWLVCPDIALSWHGMFTGLGAFRNDYILHYQTAEGGLDHSLFSLVKLLLAALGHFGLLHDAARMNHLTLVYVLVVACAGIALWIIRIRHLLLANQVLALTIVAILLPPVSFEYTLMHLYLPWAMLVFLAIQGGESSRRALFCAFILLALLVSPMTELWLLGWGLAGELKALLLLLLFALALRYPFPGRQFASSAAEDA
jgi:hypothetical protein